MRPLTILSIAYPFSPVSVDSVGGAEQVLCALDAAIVRAGHRSIVVAREGSRVAGELVPIAGDDGDLDPGRVGRAHAAVIVATARVIERERIDVVHMHGIDFACYLPLPGPPVLATLHLPPKWYPREALCPTRPRTHLCCVSKAQHAALPPWVLHADIIENGVDAAAFRPQPNKGEHCVVLARICEEKGIREALDAADLAGVPLLLAGEVSAWPAHRAYFAHVVAPRLGGRHRWVGPVGLEKKRELLARARALLVPSLAPETSSLVAMEALASGTPVIAFAAGALPEVVEHGKTGYVVGDAREMAAAIAKLSNLSPGACRRAAETRFSAERTARRYLDAYERLADRLPEVRRTQDPLVVDEVRGTDALVALTDEWSALWRRSASASPFQSPEWLLAYAAAFCDVKSCAEPWAITVRRAGALVGLAPLCTRPVDSGELTTLLGDGVSDYLDVLVDAAQVAPSTSAIIDVLRRRCGERASVFLDHLRKTSPLLAFGARPGDEILERGPCPVVRLAAGVDPLPRSMREKVRYYRRRAERMGPLEVHEATSATSAEWLDVLFDLHRARWSARGESGVLASADVQRFQRAAIPAMAARGLARLYGLRIGERRAAAMLVLCDGWAAYHYIGGFDPELAALSPGTILIAHAMERARDEGLAELDFLRGAETYKYRFGAVDRRLRARKLAEAVAEHAPQRDGSCAAGA